MKHPLLILFSMLLAATIATAQVRPYVRAGIGAGWAGLNGRSSIDLSNDITYFYLYSQASKTRPLLAGGAGVGIQVDFERRWRLQFEASVEQRGYRSNITAYSAGCSRCIIYYPPEELPVAGISIISTRLTYLNLSALAGYRLGKWSVLAGPYVGFILGEKRTGSYQLTIPSIYNPINDITQKTKSFTQPDVGLIAGLAYALTPRIETQLRYSQSIISATRADASYNKPEAVYLQSAQLGLAYTLLR